MDNVFALSEQCFKAIRRFQQLKASAMSKGAPNREPLTVRLDPESKRLFSAEAEKCGLEPGVAARQILELYVQRLRSGGDYIQALAEIAAALKGRPV